MTRLLEKVDVETEALRQTLAQELERQPRVGGPGAELGKIFVTQRLQQLLLSAQDEAKRLKDEYVSVEHLALALIEEGSKSAAGKLLAQWGVDRNRFLQALQAVRGHQRVTSANPEEAYEALEKVWRRPRRSGAARQARSGDRPRLRDPASDPHLVAQDEEQSGFDR